MSGGVRTSRLEACDVLADSFYCSSAVGPGNDVVLHWEWVFAHGDDQIAVVERGSVNWYIVSRVLLHMIWVKSTLDENIFVANLRNRSLLVELQRVETLLAFDGPLLGG
jgi:hypothetical protein